MKNINQKISLSIYNLIAALEDGKKGYLYASENIKDSVLSLLMENYGYQRGRYSIELRQLINRTGTVSPVDQYTLSLLNRTWMDLKSYFKYGKKDRIIEGCIKAEKTALKNYHHTLGQLDDNYELQVMLQEQVNGIQTVLSTIMAYAATMKT